MFNYAKNYKIPEIEKMDINNKITETNDELISKSVQEFEKILKETALQGYKYLISKNETITNGNAISVKVKYQGMHEMNESAIEMFKSLGWQFYELDKVREYLKTIQE